MFSILITLLPAVSVIMIILAILLVLSVQDSQNAKMRRGYIAVTFLIVGGFILGGSLRYEYQEMVATYVHDDHLYAARVYYASSDPDALKLFDCNRWGFGCEPIFDGRGYYHTTLFSIVPNEGQDGFALMKGTETLYTHLYQDEGV